VTVFAKAVAAALTLALVATLAAREFWAAGAAALALVVLGGGRVASARRCRLAFGRLAWRAGTAAGLEPVPVRATAAAAAPRAVSQAVDSETDYEDEIDPEAQTTAVV
jgi:hypothetical protein